MVMEDTPANLLESYHLLSYDVLDSTNEEAKRHADNGGTHGAVVWAHQQTSGKGRMGREWVSPDGNLYVSALLQPTCSLAERTQLAFLTAVSMLDTLEPILGKAGEVSCKWPNDILLDGKKIGGILLESFQTTNDFGRTQEWIVVGLGLNIMHHPESGMRYPATSLKAAGIELISAKIVLSRFVYNFIMRYDAWQEFGFSPIRECWEKAAFGMGEMVDVQVGDESISGIYESIDDAGCLMLRVNDEKVIPINASDVTFKSIEKAPEA